ncbi:MAG TPA: dihydrodipicolinate synthase family protein [Opitutaceae bacterium]|nr:dihydrodipicolinate synthase family protein [Opitutaceae bacterium]
MRNSSLLASPSGLQRRDFLQLLGAGALGLALSGRYASAAENAAGSMPTPAKRASGAKPLRGLFPIGSTPFTADDKLDLDSLAAEVKFCNRGRVHGFIWPQIASNWTTLKEDERLAGAEAILAAGKGGTTALVIGVQSKAGDMQEVARYAKHALEHGADALVALPPPNVTDEKVLLDYYQQIGRMTSLPLFVQTQGSMSIDLVVEIYKTVPTARQVKDEAGVPLERITELRRLTNNEVNFFAGQGVRTMIAEMELGFMGHCPYTGLADVYAQAFDLWHAGKQREAFDMFGRILALSSLGNIDQTRLLVARGVFKPDVHSRSGAEGGGGGGGGGAGRGGRGGGAGGAGGRGGPSMDDAKIREALDHYLKPYLRA